MKYIQFDIKIQDLIELGFSDITNEFWSTERFTIEFGTSENILHDIYNNKKYDINSLEELTNKILTRENKILFFANFLGEKVIFDEKIIGQLRGIHLDGLMNLDVIEEWDNNTPIYKKWAIEDTKLVLPINNKFKLVKKWTYNFNN